MSLVDKLLRFSAEIGRTPDFVVCVCFWLTIALGFALGRFTAKLPPKNKP